MRIILIIIGIFILSGCTTTKPSVTEYKINSDKVSAKSNVNGCKGKRLKVAQAFSSTSLMSKKMDYTQSDNKVFSYSKSQWRESPNHALSQQIFEMIRDTELFKNTQTTKSRSKSDWMLEVSIEDFLQYYSEDLKKSYSNVVITLSIIDLKISEVISSKTFSAKVDTKTLDADGGVRALNSALNDVLTQNLEWLNGVCK